MFFIVENFPFGGGDKWYFQSLGAWPRENALDPPMQVGEGTGTT